jgi:phosphoribosylformylglycinamidine synthase subunit PurS
MNRESFGIHIPRTAAFYSNGKTACGSRVCYNFCMKAHVWVMPKRTVLDPQGQTIQHALSGLGYTAITDVRQGKFFVLNLDGWSRDEAQRQLEKISKDVLTNTVIEEYRFEIVD